MIDRRRDAIATVLTVHDGMQRMVREDGLPPEAIDVVDGFLAALGSQGFTVTALRPEPDADSAEPQGASEYGRLLAKRDRLVADGVDPTVLDVPDRPL